MSATTRNRLGIWAACVLTFTATGLRADLLQMQNGDHYSGKIISMTTNSLVLESDVLGKVTLPRDKVSSMTFGAGSTASATTAVPGFTNAAPSAKRAGTVSGTNTDVTAALRRMGANTNFIQQVRQQMLTGANPAANQKYDELVSGLMSGQMNVNDIRNEAKKGIAQIHQLKQELGPQADESLDSYLSILETFVNETEPHAESQIAPIQAPPASFGTNSTALPADN
jgi:hypothetical protein